jgi:hypothetical protein
MTGVATYFSKGVDAGSKEEQLSDCNNLSGLNSLTNQILNKKIII